MTLLTKPQRWRCNYNAKQPWTYVRELWRNPNICSGPIRPIAHLPQVDLVSLIKDMDKNVAIFLKIYLYFF